jgi:hypothetical protein
MHGEYRAYQVKTVLRIRIRIFLVGSGFRILRPDPDPSSQCKGFRHPDPEFYDRIWILHRCQCKEIVKPSFTCKMHGDYRAYQVKTVLRIRIRIFLVGSGSRILRPDPDPRSQCKGIVKPSFTCKMRGDYRAYQVKQWCGSGSAPILSDTDPEFYDRIQILGASPRALPNR